MEKVKLLIIGSGPGGYVAAIRAAQLGIETTVIEKSELGGTCLNVGCIPTKALIAAAETYETILNAKSFGITASAEFDWEKVVEHAKKTVLKNNKGVEFLFKKNSIKHIKGHAKFIDSKTVEVNGEKIEAENIIIATGSSVKDLPHIKIDGNSIIGSDEALFLEKLPESIAILGGGVIGVEFAYIYSTFGVKVHIIEALETIIPFEDKEISKELLKEFKKRKVKCHVGTMVDNVEKSENGLTVFMNNGKTLEVEQVLSSIGRKPNTKGLGLENTGIEQDERGFIKTTPLFGTSVENIYAIGDVIATPMLAHTAEHEGIIAVEKIAGHEVEEIDYNLNPGCIYCLPSVASIGITQQYAEERGYNIKVGKFPFSANGKAIASNHTKGFVKVIIDEDDHKILGAHIIGHGATDLIAEFIPAMNMGATAEDIIESIHPHPTLSEASLEAVLNALGRTIHM